MCKMIKLGKPPKWANWLTQNSMAQWAWHEAKPKIANEYGWASAAKKLQIESYTEWTKTLCKKPKGRDPMPQSKVEVDENGCWWCTPSRLSFDDAPDWARWLTQDKNGTWTWHTTPPIAKESGRWASEAWRSSIEMRQEFWESTLTRVTPQGLKGII